MFIEGNFTLLLELMVFRIMTSLLFTCETGTPETSLALIVDANGRKTGKMSDWCVKRLVFHVNW